MMLNELLKPNSRIKENLFLMMFIGLLNCFLGMDDSNILMMFIGLLNCFLGMDDLNISMMLNGSLGLEQFFFIDTVHFGKNFRTVKVTIVR